MKNISFFALLFALFSCASVEIQETNENIVELQESNENIVEAQEIKSEIVVIDENKKFEDYLNSDWQKTLNQNPLFASYVGDKRANDKINSNSIKQFIEERRSEIQSLDELYKIDQSKLSEENKLNFKLKEFGLKSNIGLTEFPTYYLVYKLLIQKVLNNHLQKLV